MEKSWKTLIVDDEEIAARVLELMLKKTGISDITSVDDGEAAVELFEQGLRDGNSFSLVFLDIVMPGINGQETLKRFRACEKAAGVDPSGKAVIIMTTALTSTDSMVEAIFDGNCSDYLVKPVAPHYLREILDKNGVI